MRLTFYVTLRALTVFAWLFAIYTLTPWGDRVPADASMFTLAVAVVGSISAVTKHCARPMDEIYLAGKDAGRRELLAEQTCPEVVSLRERRELRVVAGDGS